jgi:hypothetical protein
MADAKRSVGNGGVIRIGAVTVSLSFTGTAAIPTIRRQQPGWLQLLVK